MRKILLPLILAFLLLPTVAQAATIIEPYGVWTWSGTVGGGGSLVADSLSGARLPVPGTTYEVDALRAVWGHSTSVSGSYPGLASAYTNTVSHSASFVGVYMLDVAFTNTVRQSGSTSPWGWAIANSYDTNTFGYGTGVNTLVSGSDKLATSMSGGYTGRVNEAGGTFSLNDSQIMRMVRVVNAVKTGASSWEIGVRDHAYVEQHGLWARSSVETSVTASTATISTVVNLPEWYTYFLASRTYSSATGITFAQAGNVVTGAGYTTDSTARAAIWGSSDADALSDWAELGGTSESELPQGAFESGTGALDWASEALADVFDWFSGLFWWLDLASGFGVTP